MVRVLVPLAEGFEEIEAVNVIDILRRAGIEVVTAGLKDGMVTGSHKITVQPDTDLNKIDFRDFDGLVLPGGAPGFINLGNDERILNMAREMDRAEKLVAAICAAPSVLIKAGVLQGRRATVSPSGRAEVQACADFSEERVVVDRNLVTSRAPGTALEFALKLVEVLAGREKMEEIRAQTLAVC
ncbi:MAG TPA: DJ-1/PfpI family protein [Methanothrix sp.]|jgi:4-methyl-5(b-hydroxyethyl)-thiazole monophosphate biosynthesis|nr:DJ-1/PfpI family protein [Methanothrix sp.]HPC89814.1 DJ-1/PfpI family protein [Methanothrix sp.]HQE87543.1 DJ-1/PfpI family protein [Methanothrix sp.]HQI68146.1 DJ-1/PfpI family protein [Methanothrix sp.]HRS85131.1 DJ-1/PfpI family protein [Methanothrix sp.]